MNRIFQFLRFLQIKTSAVYKLISLYENWPEVAFNRLPFLKRSPEVIYNLRNGFKVIVRTENVVEGRIVDNTYLGEYSYPGFEIRPTDCVIDIGAHIGTFTLWAAAKAPKGKIFAFEPSSENFFQLKKNIKLNNLTNVGICKMAVWDKMGFVNLYLTNISSAHFNVFGKSSKFEKVKTITLPEIFKKFKIFYCNFLKIDAEGAEFEILTSTPASILRLIDKIVFEFHPRRSAPKNLDKILATLKKNSFRRITTQERIFFLKRI